MPNRGHSGKRIGIAPTARVSFTSATAPSIGYSKRPELLYSCACSTTKAHFRERSNAREGPSWARSSRNIQFGASTASTVLPGMAARTIVATICGNSFTDVWLLPMKSSDTWAAGCGEEACVPELGPPPPPQDASSSAAVSIRTKRFIMPPTLAPQILLRLRRDPIGEKLEIACYRSGPPLPSDLRMKSSQPPNGLPIYRILTGPDDAEFCKRVS